LHHSGDARAADGWRLTAREIKPLVRARIVAFLNDSIDLLTRATNEVPSPDDLNDPAETWPPALPLSALETARKLALSGGNQET